MLLVQLVQGEEEVRRSSPFRGPQRFHGFKKMTFSNGFMDPSSIRDKVAADLFRAERATVLEKVAVDVGFAVYLGWVTVATILNVSLALNISGWSDGVPWTVRPRDPASDVGSS